MTFIFYLPANFNFNLELTKTGIERGNIGSYSELANQRVQMTLYRILQGLWLVQATTTEPWPLKAEKASEEKKFKYNFLYTYFTSSWVKI